MDIRQIKERLDILEVAAHLDIPIDKRSKKACCPFHDDKTPSLQFSQEKQIATCFSSNCNAGTMDVISLTEKKLNISTHEALKYLYDLTGEVQQTKPIQIQESPNYQKDFEQMQSSFIASSTARNYLESRSVDWKKLNAPGGSPVGYNAFKSSKFNYLRGCVTFGLRDEKGKVVSMYGRSIRNNDKARHYYTSNRKGLYPKYPKPTTKQLILTESIIDAATLLSIGAITRDYEISALYGTNGLTVEHVHAIQQLEGLKEVILFFDGDEAGKAANEKHGKYLQELLPQAKISVVETLKGEDINSLAMGHESSVFIQLLEERNPFSFSPEKKSTEVKDEGIAHQAVQEPSGLNTSNPNKITYITETAVYYIKGGIRKDLDSLKVTLVIEHLDTKAKSRNKLDLYEDKQTEKISRESAEKLNLRADLIENDLNTLTDLLDQYREQTMSAADHEEPKTVIVSGTEKEKCLAFLRRPNLLKEVNDLIGKSGVVGEENNRIFLFGIASSYKMEETLHALIQGSSGSGKTHLLATIMDFMPPEDTISLTRVTESSFYNYGKYELQNKLIGMEDYDGLEEKAELAFRELQSKGMISSSTSGKNEHTGEISGFIKEVYGPIASLSATTKGEIYEDNMSRCFLVAVDESHEQTLRIIKYQNDKAAGLVNKQKEKEIREFLRNCMRLLAPHDVVNPFANKIDLPKEAHKIRRLNDLFQSYVKQVTLLNQYQRQKDRQGRLITGKEDVRTAIEIMFDSIILKVDELDGSLRLFYEKLKEYVLQQGKEYEFIQREIRHTLKVSKTQLFRYIHQLEELEYLQKRGFGTHGAVKYKSVYWDDNPALRARIKDELNRQLERL
jgi:DNA primase